MTAASSGGSSATSWRAGPVRDWWPGASRSLARRWRGSPIRTYWGRPVPGFGDPGARVVILGLAPAAHGGNRTGRIFTGDRSGDFLLRLAASRRLREPGRRRRRADDGLRLTGAYVTAVNRCAPPANKPTPEERDTLPAVPRAGDRRRSAELRVIVALGAYAWDGALRALAALGHPSGRSRGSAMARRSTSDPFVLLGCFHPSQQNTFTGQAHAGDARRHASRGRDLAGVGRLTDGGSIDTVPLPTGG